MVDKKRETPLEIVISGAFAKAGQEHSLEEIKNMFATLDGEDGIYRCVDKLCEEYDEKNKRSAEKVAPYLLAKKTVEAVEKVTNEEGEKYIK